VRTSIKSNAPRSLASFNFSHILIFKEASFSFNSMFDPFSALFSRRSVSSYLAFSLALSRQPSASAALASASSFIFLSSALLNSWYYLKLRASFSASCDSLLAYFLLFYFSFWSASIYSFFSRYSLFTSSSKSLSLFAGWKRSSVYLKKLSFLAPSVFNFSFSVLSF
jgi:hypothetical protein